MAYVQPFLTSDSLVESVKLRMMFPLSQQTFTYNDILKIANEEMMINAVPQVKEAHQEYFVFKVIVPIVQNVARYEIPYRALGMTLSDLFYSDQAGNYIQMVRVAPQDKAFFQNNYGNNQNSCTYYLEGNQVVLSSQTVSGPTGNLNFFIYLRPNYLVRNSRAATIESYWTTIGMNSPAAGDQITISTDVLVAHTPTVYVFTAVSGAPTTDYEFQIDVDNAVTCANLETVINNAAIPGIVANATASNVDITYEQLSDTFVSSDNDNISIDNEYVYITFDQLDSTWTDPDTEQTSDLYTNGCLVDFLQTDAGHSTYNYDVELVEVDGTTGKFLARQLQTYMNNNSGGTLSFLPIKVGDYICPQNECIIPQIPSELHYALAERCASFVLQAIGDQEGLARSNERIEKMNEAQSAIIDSRITGSVPKVFNPNSILRSFKTYRRWRF
jgi:hypothetical protein